MWVGPERTQKDRGPSRVVIVDDDPAVRSALGRLLRVGGWEVRAFGSAEEFLESCDPAEVDCLIVDVYLGGMSGIDLHSRLGLDGQPPPTVFVTAHDDAPVLRMCLRGQGVAYLRKPFEDRSLFAAIQRAVTEMQS
jgi:FixJ family two-component response regulator